MSTKVYTYTKLIQGHTVARNASQNALYLGRSRMTPDEIKWHEGLMDYLDDEIRRLSLLRTSCGDTTVIVR